MERGELAGVWEYFQMVLSRQTGTEEKLGTPSLRHHAMPSPLYTLLTPLLLATIFSFFLSNLIILAAHCPPDFYLLSLTLHLIFTSHPILPSLSSPLPSLQPLHPWVFLLIPTCLAVCCPIVRPNQSSTAPPPLPTASFFSYGGRQSPALRLHWGVGLEYSPEGRQLSISDNSRERDTHACAHTPFHSPSTRSFINQGAIT